jgi:hypothetical protein
MPSVDDDSLRSMLDALSDSAGNEPDSPIRSHAVSSFHASAPVFDPNDLASAISLANSLVSNTGVTTRIHPLVDEKADTARRALASAVSIIVTLVRSREANTNLRYDAEKKLQIVKEERDRALQVVERLGEQIASRDSNLRDTRSCRQEASAGRDDIIKV